MLNRKNNILLNEDDYTQLLELAEVKERSVGSLIRHALKQTYGLTNQESRKKILQNIARISQNANTKGVNYLKLIADGRRY